MPRIPTGLRAPKNNFFPKLDRGFWADLTSCNEHIRLFVHLDEVRWVSSVYNRRTKEWIAESTAAKDSDDAKRMAERVGRRFVPGDSAVEWHGIGRCGF